MKERKEKKNKGKKGITSGPYCFLIESHDNDHIGGINIDKKYPNTKERKKEQVLALHCLWLLVLSFVCLIKFWGHSLIQIKEGYTWFQRIEYGVPRW